MHNDIENFFSDLFPWVDLNDAILDQNDWDGKVVCPSVRHVLNMYRPMKQVVYINNCIRKP